MLLFHKFSPEGIKEILPDQGQGLFTPGPEQNTQAEEGIQA